MSPRKRSPHFAGEPYTSWQAAVHLGRSKRWVTQQAARGRFLGAVCDSRGWTLPADAVESDPSPRRTSETPLGMSVAEAAELFELAPNTVSQRCRDGDLPGAIKDRGRWLIPESAVKAALRSTTEKPTPPAWWATSARSRTNGRKSVASRG